MITERARRSRRPARLAAVVALVAALVAGACSAGGGGDAYTVTAEFTRGIGLYPGSPVRLLGIDVGRLTDVENVADKVVVTMDIDAGTDLPADATATIVPLSLLGERYVQFSPVYESGPKLAGGDTIPLDRTRVPAEIDELLRGFDDFIGAIDPAKATAVVENLAVLLEGRGDELNDLFANASGTLDTLADKSVEIGDVIESLATLNTTLQTRTDGIQRLVRNYEIVSGVLAQNRDDVDRTISELDRAVRELAGLLTRHQEPLKEDVATLATTGRTLTSNLDSLDLALASTVKLFEAAGRAYDPDNKSLPLNNQGAPDVTGELIAFRIRDRLSGICRRLGVVSCADPSTAFFNDLVGQIPRILAELPITGEPIPLGDDPTQTPPEPGPAGQAKAAAPPGDVDLDAVVREGLAMILDQLTPEQRAEVNLLGPDLLAAVGRLLPVQRQTLQGLSPAELAGLRDVAPDELGAALDDLGDPAAMLEPLLPPAGAGPSFGRPLQQVLDRLGLGGGR